MGVGTELPQSTAVEKAGRQRDIYAPRPPAEVNSYRLRMAEFLGFSALISKRRDCPHRASWRRERSATRNILHFRAHPRGNVARVEI
jgi:hypothetical protein